MTSAVIPTHRVEKPWGRDDLPAPFATGDGVRVGEIWFDPPPHLEEILVKYLFTSEALSVQAHPSDENSPSGRGKEECWLITAAEPGAKLALGFRHALTPEQLRAAALDGSIEGLLAWHEVTPGDFFYVPAGTVHAIGAGLTLIEVQQNCGLTYRLYDYGRPRELHLDEAAEVALLEPYSDDLRQCVAPDETRLLVDGPHFRLAHVCGRATAALKILEAFAGAVQVVPVAGDVRIDGEVIAVGQSGWASATAKIEAGDEARWLLCAPLS